MNKLDFDTVQLFVFHNLCMCTCMCHYEELLLVPNKYMQSKTYIFKNTNYFVHLQRSKKFENYVFLLKFDLKLN